MVDWGRVSVGEVENLVPAAEGGQSGRQETSQGKVIIK